MKKFFGGLVVGAIFSPLAIATYLLLGMAPVATNARPMPLERFIAGTALSSRIGRESRNNEPASFTTDDLMDGAAVYKKHCAVCHGAHQEGVSSLGKAMYPPAPQLLTEGESTEQPAGVIYWEVQNGIRLSGMPSFDSILSEKQKWDVSAVLTRLTKLPQQAEDSLKSMPSPVCAPADRRR